MTEGRYYFADPSTPFYPGLHLLGSATWDNSEVIAQHPLGQVRPFKMVWSPGDEPARIPLNRIVGTISDIEQGALADDAVSLIDMPYGFNRGCFHQPIDFDGVREFFFRIHRCREQAFYARIIELMYADDEQGIIDKINTVAHGQCQITVHPAGTFLPSVTTIVHPDYAVAIVDGTRNFQQIALQGFYFLGGPQNFGSFATMPLWHSAGQIILQYLKDDGYDYTKSVCFVGHSFGAVAACVAAVKLAVPNVAARRDVLTFGMPKPGDQRLIDRIKERQAVHIANEDDVITILPFQGSILNPITGALGQFISLLWPGWAAPVDVQKLSPDGRLVYANADEPETAVVLAMITSALANDPLDPIRPHFIEEYIRRLRSRCPDPVLGAVALVDVSPPTGRIALDVIPVPISKLVLPDLSIEIPRLVLPALSTPERALNLVPVRGNCPCCPLDPAPGNIVVTVHSTDIPGLDGLTGTFTFIQNVAVGCAWTNTTITDGTWQVFLSIQASLGFPFLTGVGSIRYLPTGGSFPNWHTIIHSFDCPTFTFDLECVFSTTFSTPPFYHVHFVR